MEVVWVHCRNITRRHNPQHVDLYFGIQLVSLEEESTFRNASVILRHLTMHTDGDALRYCECWSWNPWPKADDTLELL